METSATIIPYLIAAGFHALSNPLRISGLDSSFQPLA
jgi:hypothetical protein